MISPPESKRPFLAAPFSAKKNASTRRTRMNNKRLQLADGVPLDDTVSLQTERLFNAHRLQIFRQTDRMFAGLMMIQWAAAIVAALLISPYTWIGQSNQVHVHVWAAVFLGGAISVLPVV